MFHIAFNTDNNYQTRDNRKFTTLKYMLAMELLIILNLPK